MYLNDEEFCLAEGEMLAAVGMFLKGMDRELARVMPTHHARQHTPRDHTHKYEMASRHRAWDVPQTTAGCAINFAAFGQHADLNGGFLSPFVCLTPQWLKQQQCPPAAMQFVNALAYIEVPKWDEGLGGVPTHWFNPDTLHGFRPSVEILTQDYVDYARDTPMREAPQNTAWKLAQERARDACKAHLVREGPGFEDEWNEAELELEVQLRCGPMPLAGLLQERCLSHMKSQRGDTRRVERAPQQPEQATKRKAVVGTAVSQQPLGASLLTHSRRSLRPRPSPHLRVSPRPSHLRHLRHRVSYDEALGADSDGGSNSGDAGLGGNRGAGCS